MATGKIYFITLSIITLALFSSCQQRLYFPDKANSPGLTKALEGKVTLSAKMQANDNPNNNGNNNGNGNTNNNLNNNSNANASAALDVSFSPVYHLGIIGSYRWLNNRYIDENQSTLIGNKTVGGTFNGDRWEVGAGYYDVFGRRGKVEIYGGYGNGSINRFGTELPEYNYNTKYHRFFMQPAMGFGIGQFMSFTGGFRLAVLKYYDFQAPDSTLQYNIDGAGRDVTNSLYLMFEPFVNVEGGYKFIKGNIQIGAARPISDTRIAGNFPVYISMGLVFHFDPDFFTAKK